MHLYFSEKLLVESAVFANCDVFEVAENRGPLEVEQDVISHLYLIEFLMQYLRKYNNGILSF